MGWVQFNKKTGEISAYTANKVDMPADLPVSQAEVQGEVNFFEDKINPVTKKLEKCPLKARRKRITELRQALQDIDVRRSRALEDFILDGDKTAMQSVRDQATPLRVELSKLLSLGE